MKKTYIAPNIERNSAGNMNKYGAKSVVRHQDNIEGVPISQLVKDHGSPLIVLSEAQMRKRYRRLLDVMKMHYPKVELAWSYKTNYLGAVCNIFHQEGARAEVVSRMEYEMARRLGIEGKDIIFNGPGKSPQALRIAIQESALIHIDHLDELYMIEKLAREMDMVPQVAIRVNMDTGISPQWTRFGFNYENGEAYRTVQRLLSGKTMKLRGLHTHIGTFILDANAYYWAAKALLDLAQRIEQEHDVVLEYIDMGGGFASQNTLHAQYTPGEFASPSFDQYASAIGNAFNESSFVSKNVPTLILETGRALVDEAGSLISSVLGKKNLPTGERAIILDAGVNTAITAWWYKLKVLPTRSFPGAYQNTIFYGPLCMNIDVIRPAVPFPDLHFGDTVVISPTGAYNNTQWMQFIEYRPQILLITETGQVELLRESETLQDVIARERIPEHLSKI
ncbi:MAG: alanine racemase [Candidatus Cloacimonadaceae bacterium]|jgi:diaminopimelate decarboxylase|nr:alanine racemase [Candidatus Cloacimonadota bacterium]MDY0126785.1 alanine racemase [Candidatus Cloacimonadaceae bacterium]MCB5254233.1 alanine racemase [Candidatus Cloacimonadota bacterium]MCK9177514.1 alanine racemase [Candidatus Cloacimonadota bacterium]MCK9242118.1 alanine racemase [Candidatus Cloacimonadota bacterium]